MCNYSPSQHSLTVLNQPEPTSWEALPYHYHLREEDALLIHSVASCPPGLEFLILTTRLFVKKTGKTFEFLMNRRRQYKILDDTEDEIFYAEESTDACSHLCCGKYPIELKISDLPFKKEVMRFYGYPGICGGGGKIVVKHSGSKRKLGATIQDFDCQNPIFSIVNSKGVKTLEIEGPQGGNCWGLAINAEFNIKSLETKDIIGRIIRNDKVIEWKVFTTHRWTIEFPQNLESETKASLLSAVFLLDFQYYS